MRRVAVRRAARHTLLVTFASSFALAAPRLDAQGAGGAPPRPENLKVLPKDISRDSLLNTMRGFALALGVRCQYCHVTEPAPASAAGGPGPQQGERFKFAADDKVPKQKARFMLRMVDSLNHVVLASLPDRRNPPVEIQCVTCHRGQPVPTTLQQTLSDIVARYGADSAAKRYAQLREDMISGRWDFSETTLNELARTLAANGKRDDAIAMLELNQKYFPSSADIDFQLGETYLAKGDKDKAIQRFQAVLTKRPNDNRARQRLQQLGVGG